MPYSSESDRAFTNGVYSGFFSIATGLLLWGVRELISPLPVTGKEGGLILLASLAVAAATAYTKMSPDEVSNSADDDDGYDDNGTSRD